MIQPFEYTVNKLKEFGLLTSSEEKEADDFFLYVEKNTKPKTNYILFLEEFNKITKKRYTGDVISRRLFYKQSVNFSFDELVRCVNNAMKNPYYTNTNTKIVTPSWILQKENLNTYLNYITPKKTEHDNSKQNNSKKYSDVEL